MTTNWADIDRMPYVRPAPQALPPLRWEPVTFEYAQGQTRMCVLDSGLSLFRCDQVTLGPGKQYASVMGVMLPDGSLLRVEARTSGDAELHPVDISDLDAPVLDALRKMHSEGVQACSTPKF